MSQTARQASRRRRRRRRRAYCRSCAGRCTIRSLYRELSTSVTSVFDMLCVCRKRSQLIAICRSLTRAIWLLCAGSAVGARRAAVDADRCGVSIRVPAFFVLFGCLFRFHADILLTCLWYYSRCKYAMFGLIFVRDRSIERFFFRLCTTVATILRRNHSRQSLSSSIASTSQQTKHMFSLHSSHCRRVCRSI